MPVISVRDSQNNRWKRRVKTKHKDRKKQRSSASSSESLRAK